MAEKFTKENDPDGYKQLLKDRGIIKKNLAKGLKEQLYMTDKEIELVLNIVENAQSEADYYKSKVSYSHYTLKYHKYLGETLNKIYGKMAEDVKSEIKRIMDEKVAIAKFISETKEKADKEGKTVAEIVKPEVTAKKKKKKV